nr:transposase (putative), gypsy type [Tanacetum cinerariifolium]
MKSSTTNVETPINDEVFHEVSESFQGESSSSSLNDDVQQSLEEVIPPQKNTQSISINMIPNGDEASTSHNVFNDRLEDAYFDASAPVDVSDPDPLSFADPRSLPTADVAQSSKGAAVAGDPKSENTSFTSMVGSPESIYRPKWGVTNGCLLDALEACQDLVDHVEAKLLKKSIAQVARRDKRIQARDNEIKNLETLLEAKTDMKKTAKGKSAKLSRELEKLWALFSDLQVSDDHLSQLSTLQAQVTGEEKLKAAFEEFKQYKDNQVEKRCAKMDARLDALSIDFDEELYPHMLTAIAGRRWVIGHGLRLAVMKYDELTELSSSQLKIPMYPEVRDLTDPWGCKEEILLADAIAANVSRAEKKKKCRVVEKRCAKMDARLDALSIDFDEELYPHMLTAITGRRWVIGHGLHLAVMKCGESIELRQVFADVMSAGIAKGMSEGLKYGVEYGKANLSLESIEAYDPEAKAKYIAALHALKDLKYPIVDQLESLKDAPMDVIMASLHLDSDTGDDAPQWIHELRISSSQLKIPMYPEVRDPTDPWGCKEEILLADAIAANVSRAEKKKKCRVVCRTLGAGFAHHARFNGVPVFVPTVAL